MRATLYQHPRATVTFQPDYVASPESIQRAKAEAAKERAEYEQIRQQMEVEKGAAILQIVELIEKYGAARVHRWVKNTAIAMGEQVCQ